MNATTLSRVKLALRIDDAVTDEDGRLNMLIIEASAQVEAYLNRPFLSASRVELYDVRDQRQLSLFLRSSPVASITELARDPAGNFTGDETVYTADDYLLNPTTGELRFRFQPVPGFQTWRVTYTAGLVADTAAMIATYPTISRAVDLQVAALYLRIADPQTDSRNLGGAAIKVNESMGLISAARSTCGMHRALRF